MKVPYLLLLVLLLPALNVFAQRGNAGLVAGKIKDGESGIFLPSAVVSIINQYNGKVVKSTRTDDRGEFIINTIPFGNYSLTVTHIGFGKEIIEDIELTADNPVFNTGIIRLKKSDNPLKEVVITEQKRVVTFDADQITYNVAESLLAEGSTASDILRDVPMVNVDIDGVPSIAGKRNTRIFIDGEPSDYMSDNIGDLLAVLPSDAIEKIEVILNPPVKYSADGDGIINIILKKDFKIGINGIASLGTGTLGNFNGNTYLTHKRKKLSFTGSYGFTASPVTSNNTTNQHFFSDTSFYRNLYSNSNAHNFGHNISQGTIWAIDDAQTLRVSSNLNFNRAIGQSAGGMRYLNYNQAQSSANTSVNNNWGNSNNYVVNLNYGRRLKKNGGRIDAGFAFSGNGAATNRFLLRNYQNAKDLPLANATPFEQTYLINQGYTGGEAKIDYEKPFGKNKNTAAFGLAADIRSNNNNQDVENINFKTNVHQQVASLSNVFTYRQSIYAAYASTTFRTKKGFIFRVGARAELAAADFTLQTVNQPLAKGQYINPYVHVFPNLSISKRVRNKFTLGLSYNVRTARPNNTALNPALPTPDSNSVTYRNINIVPAYSQQADLSLGVFNQRWSFYPRLSFAYTDNTIERFITLDRLGRARYQYNNLGASNYYTLNLYGDYRPATNLTINGGTTIGEIFYSQSTYLPTSISAFSYYAKLGASLSLKHNLGFEANVNYYTSPFAQGNNVSPINTGLAVRQTFYHNRLRLRVAVTSPFGQSNYNALTHSYNFYWQSVTTVNTRNYGATVSYNFGGVKK